MNVTRLHVDLFQAYYDARKNKRNTPSAQAFEVDYERKLFILAKDLHNRTYRPGTSTCFIVKKPVQREVFAADFRDRIVHHLIFNYLSPIFERYFIPDSYSCRVGKGTSYGIKRVDHFIRSCSHNYTRECYILKLDIQGYFMAMDKHILYEFIVEKLQREVVTSYTGDFDFLLYVIQTVLFHDPTKDYRIKGCDSDWTGLPKSKSLFCARKDTGLPIGNLTSQLFGNIYMNNFDHFVRDSLGCSYYGRYVDDMICVDQDQEYLKSIIGEIKVYLQKHLKLTLHPKKIYLQSVHKGIAFLGVYIKPYRIYIGSRAKHNFRANIESWKKSILHSLPRAGEIKEIVAISNSYLGMMKQYQTFTLRKKMIRKLEYICGLYIGHDHEYGKMVKQK